MKKTVVCIALAGLVALGGQAFAVIGTADSVPASTLLLPYFAVDLDDPNQLTTLFSINNASAAPAIAHVTLWTDWSIPTLDFNVYLTGYDVYTINLRDLFISGTVPGSNHLGAPESPVGLFSSVTTANPLFAPSTCDPQLPLPPLLPVQLQHIQAAHTGQPSPLDPQGPVPPFSCWGEDHGDNVARGYITVDNVNTCTLQFPNNAGYFAPGGPGDNIYNQLWGDYFYVDVTNNFAQGEELVHIEGDAQLGPGNYTFYARYSGGADRKEGLSSTFAVRHAAGGFPGIPGGTNLLVWRDAKFANLDPSPAYCGGNTPSPFPLSQNQIVIFDEFENPVVPESSPFSPPLGISGLEPFPLEANDVAVGGADFPVPDTHVNGWLFLNLNNVVAGQSAYFDLCGDGGGGGDIGSCMQNWVTVLINAAGRFSVGFDAITLDNVTFDNRIDWCLTDLPPAGPGDGGATVVCPQ